MLKSVSPFVLPIMGEADRLAALCRMVEEMGFSCAIYQVDLARNMCNPKFAPALLIPCHQDVTPAALDDLLRALRSHRLCITRCSPSQPSHHAEGPAQTPYAASAVGAL
jgi:hypothetical protein